MIQRLSLLTKIVGLITLLLIVVIFYIYPSSHGAGLADVFPWIIFRVLIVVGGLSLVFFILGLINDIVKSRIRQDILNKQK
jgi:hypothetical protein